MNTLAPMRLAKSSQQPEVATAAKLFAGLGDPTRLSIIRTLVAGEHRVTDIVEALGGSQGNISGHLRCLKECGLVADRPQGREVHYRVADDDVVDLLRSAERLLQRTGPTIDLCSNYQPLDQGEPR